MLPYELRSRQHSETGRHKDKSSRCENQSEQLYGFARARVVIKLKTCYGRSQTTLEKCACVDTSAFRWLEEKLTGRYYRTLFSPRMKLKIDQMPGMKKIGCKS